MLPVKLSEGGKEVEMSKDGKKFIGKRLAVKLAESKVIHEKEIKK